MSRAARAMAARVPGVRNLDFAERLVTALDVARPTVSR